MSNYRSADRERTFAAWDVENLACTGRLTASTVAQVLDEARKACGSPTGALETIGLSSSRGVVEAAVACPSSRLVWSPGSDGADRSLLDVLGNEDIARRFNRVIIGSGDGIFTDVASQLIARGCFVTVVARQGGLSRRLEMAVDEVRVLATLDETTGALAAAG